MMVWDWHRKTFETVKDLAPWMMVRPRHQSMGIDRSLRVVDWAHRVGLISEDEAEALITYVELLKET
jgi:hypothetical protein